MVPREQLGDALDGSAKFASNSPYPADGTEAFRERRDQLALFGRELFHNQALICAGPDLKSEESPNCGYCELT